jgi:hypothetical protein
MASKAMASIAVLLMLVMVNCGKLSTREMMSAVNKTNCVLLIAIFAARGFERCVGSCSLNKNWHVAIFIYLIYWIRV